MYQTKIVLQGGATCPPHALENDGKQRIRLLSNESQFNQMNNDCHYKPSFECSHTSKGTFRYTLGSNDRWICQE